MFLNFTNSFEFVKTKVKILKFITHFIGFDFDLTNFYIQLDYINRNNYLNFAFQINSNLYFF